MLTTDGPRPSRLTAGLHYSSKRLRQDSNLQGFLDFRSWIPPQRSTIMPAQFTHRRYLARSSRFRHGVKIKMSE